MERKWIPVEERLPDTDNYILLSIENFTMADIGRYELDEEGNGTFYPGDDDKSYVSYGLFVTAWMSLPEPYVPEKTKVEATEHIVPWQKVILSKFLNRR